MGSNGKEIDIVAVDREYTGPDDLVTDFRLLASNMRDRPSIFLFPEEIFWGRPILRSEGISLAERLHEIANEVGDVYAVYSLFEGQEPERRKGVTKYKYVTNTGYIVCPDGEHFVSYFKISTADRGEVLCGRDWGVISENTHCSGIAKRYVYVRAKALERFPRVDIDSAPIEVRLCTDATLYGTSSDGKSHIADSHPAKLVCDPMDLMLVPAYGLELTERDSGYILKQLNPDGLAIVLNRRLTSTSLSFVSHSEPTVMYGNLRDFSYNGFRVRGVK